MIINVQGTAINTQFITHIVAIDRFLYIYIVGRKDYIKALYSTEGEAAFVKEKLIRSIGGINIKKF